MLLSLLAFSGAAFLIVLLPGPDTLVVVRSLVRSGRASAVRTVAGVLTGLAVWVGAAALGLSALLRASHDGYVALRIVGAAYLIWIGVQSLRAHVSTPQPADPGTDSNTGAGTDLRRRSLIGNGYGAGLATDLLNPKVGVFFVAFLPGFVPHGFAVGPVTLLLGAIFIVETALYFTVLMLASQAVTRWMRTPRIQRRMDRTTGVILIGFGARLALEP